jgi:hypothetical protein
MNYPANATKLGLCSFSDVDFDLKVNLQDFEDPMRIALKIAEFSLLDSTPFYSHLYGERLSLKPNENRAGKMKPKLVIDILKVGFLCVIFRHIKMNLLLYTNFFSIEPTISNSNANLIYV